MKARDIIDGIVDRIEDLENNHLFNNYEGFAQVEGKGEQLNRFFGMYSALVALYEEITNSTWISKPQKIRLH